MRFQIALSSQQLTILMVRPLAFAIFLIVVSNLAFGQFDMPQRSSPSTWEAARSERQNLSVSDTSPAVAPPSVRAGGKGIAGNTNPQSIQFQVTSTQYKALKYFITGGCVTLIFVLIGSMLRLSGSEPSSDGLPRHTAHPYPQYPGFTPAGYGFQPTQPDSSSPEKAASETVGETAQLGVTNQGNTKNAPGIQLPPTAMGWPVSYIPTLPIGVPIPIHPDVLIAGNHAGATSEMSPKGMPETARATKCNEEGNAEALSGLQPTNEILEADAAEDIQVPNSASFLGEGIFDSSSEEVISVEEILLQHLNKVQSEVVTEVTACDLDIDDQLDAQCDKSGGENLDQLYVLEPETHHDAIPSDADSCHTDEIPDPIAEDLANLPVETYGEEIQSETVDKLEAEIRELRSPNEAFVSERLEATVQPIEAEEEATQQTPSSENFDPSIIDQTEHRGRSMSIFDSIVANTIEVKSLAS
ncbi:MAG: hypothetical protein VXZ38_04415 [Planctomycetota bacterium]|nr:hypothetical protein [Planctomycetota bacterium]